MSADTLFDEQANLSPDDEMERGGDEQIVRKLIAGGLLRRARLRRLLLARLLRQRQDVEIGRAHV